VAAACAWVGRSPTKGVSPIQVLSLLVVLAPVPVSSEGQGTASRGAPREVAAPLVEDRRCERPETIGQRGSGPSPLSCFHELRHRGLGHRLRGDWEPPDVLLLAFTERWSESLADLAAIAEGQTRVFLLADPAKHSPTEVRSWVSRHGLDPERVVPLWLGHDTPWVRDYGPLQVIREDGEPEWLDARYVQARPADDAIPPLLASRFGVPWEPVPIRLAGGAVISNGRGLCASTIEYLRESELDVEDPGLMDPLLEKLGCRVLAVVPGLVAEKAHHIDMFAQFLAADLVAVGDVDPAEGEEDAGRMNEATRGLVEAAARLDINLRVVRVPLPYLGSGKYRTYVNGLRLRNEFVVPSYSDVQEEVQLRAVQAISEALPGVGVVPVPADKVIALLGSLHCISLGLALPREGGRSPSLPWSD